MLAVFLQLELNLKQKGKQKHSEAIRPLDPFSVRFCLRLSLSRNANRLYLGYMDTVDLHFVCIQNICYCYLFMFLFMLLDKAKMFFGYGLNAKRLYLCT